MYDKGHYHILFLDGQKTVRRRLRDASERLIAIIRMRGRFGTPKSNYLFSSSILFYITYVGDSSKEGILMNEIAKSVLPTAALQAMRQFGGQLSPLRGKAELWKCHENGTKEIFSVKTSKKRWFGFARPDEAGQWSAPLDRAQTVFVAALDAPQILTSIEVYRFPADEVRGRLDRKWAKEIAHGRRPKAVWLHLDELPANHQDREASGLAKIYPPAASSRSAASAASRPGSGAHKTGKWGAERDRIKMEPRGTFPDGSNSKGEGRLGRNARNLARCDRDHHSDLNWSGIQPAILSLLLRCTAVIMPASKSYFCSRRKSGPGRATRSM